MATITAALVKELRERTGAGMMECKKALVETSGDIEQAIENMRKSGQAKAAKKAGRIAAEGIIVMAIADDNRTACMLEVNCETDFVARDENFVGFANHTAERALSDKIDNVDALLAVAYEQSSDITVEQARQNLVAKIGENIQVRRVALIAADTVVGHYLHGVRIGALVNLKGGDVSLAKDIAMHVAAVNPQAVSADSVDNQLLEKEKAIFMAQAENSGKPQEIIEKMVQGRIKKYLKEICLVDQAFVKNQDVTVGELLKAKQAEVISFTRYEVGEGIEKQEDDFVGEVMAQARGE